MTKERGLDQWPLIGQHPLLLEVQEHAGRVANSDLSVNISGETGTGKELLRVIFTGLATATGHHL